MTKDIFLQKLKGGIEHFPIDDQDEILSFYEECISDAKDTGETETSFINKIGPIDALVKRLEKDYTLEIITTEDNWSLIKNGFKGIDNFSTSLKVGFGLSVSTAFILLLVAVIFILRKSFFLIRDIFYFPEMGFNIIVPKLTFIVMGLGGTLLLIYTFIKIFELCIDLFANRQRENISECIMPKRGDYYE